MCFERLLGAKRCVSRAHLALYRTILSDVMEDFPPYSGNSVNQLYVCRRGCGPGSHWIVKTQHFRFQRGILVRCLVVAVLCILAFAFRCTLAERSRINSFRTSDAGLWARLSPSKAMEQQQGALNLREACAAAAAQCLRRGCVYPKRTRVVAASLHPPRH